MFSCESQKETETCIERGAADGASSGARRDKEPLAAPGAPGVPAPSNLLCFTDLNPVTPQ